jgi:hypothetical protein
LFENSVPILVVSAPNRNVDCSKDGRLSLNLTCRILGDNVVFVPEDVWGDWYWASRRELFSALLEQTVSEQTYRAIYGASFVHPLLCILRRVRIFWSTPLELIYLSTLEEDAEYVQAGLH